MPEREARRPIPVAEWIVAALGAVLVAGTIGYLVWLPASRDETPPDVRVVAGGVVALQDGWLVEFRAANAGGQAAAGAAGRGRARGPGRADRDQRGDRRLPAAAAPSAKAACSSAATRAGTRCACAPRATSIPERP